MKTISEALALYTENYSTVSRLAKYKFTLDCETSQILHQVAQVSTQIQNLKDQNQVLLDTCIFPLLSPSYELNQEEIEILDQYASSELVSRKTKDIILLRKIYEKLLSHAESISDEPSMIRYFYQCGVAVYTFNASLTGKDHYTMKNPYFLRAMDYFPKYHSYDPATRTYLVRCMHNHSTDFHEGTEEAIKNCVEWLLEEEKFLCNEDNRKETPEVPWDKILLACHHQLSTHILNATNKGFGFQYVPIAVRTMKEILGGNTYQEIGFSMKYFYHQALYARALYYNKELTAHQFIEILTKIYDHHNINDESFPGIQLNMLIPSFLLSFLKDDEVMPNEQKLAIQKQVNQNIYDYINHFHFTHSEGAFVHEVSNFMNTGSFENNLAVWKERMRKLLIDIHPPTYIHSMMVAEITNAIAEEILQEKPSLFIGFQDMKSIEEIKTHQEEILSFIKDAAFFHDIGKLYVLEPLCQYARNLTDEEFGLLKQHPLYGKDRLEANSVTKPYGIVAYYHHIFYNGKGGYPSQIEGDYMKYRIATDIVTISDSIDAATDAIGRCYTKAKTLDILIKELQDGAGVRYNPDVVQFVSGHSLKAKIQHLLTEKRSEIYIDICKKLSTLEES